MKKHISKAIARGMIIQGHFLIGPMTREKTSSSAAPVMVELRQAGQGNHQQV